MSLLDPFRKGNMREIRNGTSKKVNGTPVDTPPVAAPGTDNRGEDVSPRTWFFFYLICLVAILWATFLLVREEMVWLSFAMVIIAAGSGMFLFIHDIKLRTLFFFYLICLVAILWAVFLLVREEFLWVSIFLVLVSAGMSIFVYFLGDRHLISGHGKAGVQDSSPVHAIQLPDRQEKTGDETGQEEEV
jgi:multisubunit Na+/H+ antiporter MnhC subunit